LLSGDPAARAPFWGFRFNLAAGMRVNPLRIACVLDSPSVVLAADPALLDQLPDTQKNLLGDWAISHELAVMDSAAALRSRLQEEAPDILYLFARLDEGALRLGSERVTLEQVRADLARAAHGNLDPIVFLQVTGALSQEEEWASFLAGAVQTFHGV